MRSSSHCLLSTLRVQQLSAGLSIALIVWSQATAASRTQISAFEDNNNPSLTCETDLRQKIANAVDGDTINISLLGCSEITLASGAIVVIPDNLTLTGAGADALAIKGDASQYHYNRIFDHTGIGRLTISGMTLTDAHHISDSALGGCVYSMGTVDLKDAIVTGCEVEAPASSAEVALGGGVYAREGVYLSHTVVSHNKALSQNNQAVGGGIFSHGMAEAKYSTIANNEAISSSAEAMGGGIAVWGSGNVSVISSSVYGNVAELYGGISTRTTGATVIANSTLSGNQAKYVGGAAIDGDATIQSSTVTQNEAATGNLSVGVQVSGTLTASSSIFANNLDHQGEPAIDLGANVLDIAGVNIIVRALNALPAGTIEECPRLTGLGPHGGPTLTHGLVAGSAGIDSGENEVLSMDQRGEGFPRVFGSRADVGAVEWQGELDDAIFRSAFENACDVYD